MMFHQRNSTPLVPIGPLLVLAVIMALPQHCCAEGDGVSSLRCAWIATTDSPVLALAEARILAEPQATWLERAEIGRVLAEKRLQEAFGAAAVSERVGLGNLLQADLLVMARTGQHDQQPYAELLVAETGGGMRILARRVPLSENAEADAEKLAKLVSSALKKLGATIREVFAVSPFLSQDLGFEHAHLRFAYARLLQEMLLAQEGVLVVELEEAEVLSREYALAAPGSVPIRRLPTYVLGEFRHEGRGETLEVKLTLALRRGEERLGESTRSMRPENAPAYFREMLAKWLTESGTAVHAPDAVAEVRTLASRTEEFSLLGQWREALDVAEAGLLLDPGQDSLRYRAIRAARLSASAARFDRTEAYEQCMPLLLRSLEHANAIVENRRFNPGHLAVALYGGGPSDRYSMFFRAHDAGSAIPEKLLATVLEIGQEERRLSWLLADRFAEEKNWPMWASCVKHAVSGELPSQEKAQVYAAILKSQDQLPQQAVREIWLSCRPSLENRRFFSAILDSPDANEMVRAAAQLQLARIDHGWKSMQNESRKRLSPAEPAGVLPQAEKRGGLTFKPFEVKYRTVMGEESVDARHRWLALQDKIDLLAVHSGMLLLKERGNAVPVPLGSGPFGANTREQFLTCPPSHDGKYLWTVIGETIYVVDPVSARTRPIGSAQGLPDLTLSPGATHPYMPRLQVVGLSPGKALAVGFNGRTWYALVTFDQGGSPTIEVIHEAHESPQHRAISGESDHLSPDVAFVPRSMQLLTRETADGKTLRTVLVWRDGSNAMLYHPALVDPVEKTVTISQRQKTEFRDKYFIHCVRNGKVHLATQEPPDGEVKIVIPNVMDGHLIVHEDEIHIVGREWWRGSLSGGQLESCGPVPWSFKSRFASGDFSVERPTGVAIVSAGYSNHYGPFVACRSARQGTRLLQALLDGTGVAFDEALGLGNAPETPPNEVADRSPLKVCFRVPQEPETLWLSPSLDCTDLAFTADEKHILTLHQRPNKGLRLWDASSGHLVADLLNGEPTQSVISVSRSGDYFVTGGCDGSVILWSARDWKPIHFLKRRGEAILGTAFSWSERFLATAGGHEAVVWDIVSGREVTRVAENSRIRWLGFTPDDSTLISSPGWSNCWRVEDGAYRGMIESLDWVAGLRADRKILGLAGNLANSLVAWDAETETCEEIAREVRGVPTDFSRDGRRMVLHRREEFVDGQRKEIYRKSVWDLERNEEIFVYPGTGLIATLRLSPDGNTLFVLGEAKGPWRFLLPNAAGRSSPSRGPELSRDVPPSKGPSE